MSDFTNMYAVTTDGAGNYNFATDSVTSTDVSVGFLYGAGQEGDRLQLSSTVDPGSLPADNLYNYLGTTAISASDTADDTSGTGYIIYNIADDKHYMLTDSTLTSAGSGSGLNIGRDGSGTGNGGGCEMACFMPGTRILTPNGEVCVEDLKVGDLVETCDGRKVPVRWIWRRTVKTIFAGEAGLPIRIKAGALAANVPACDLLVSADHALFIDDILIQAGALVNGTSIVRDSNVPRTFVYYHVELHDHSLIFAENTPTETFIDNIDRMAFDNWDEHERLYAGTAPLVEMPYPRAKAHRQVPPAIRRQLATRAAPLSASVAIIAA